MNILDLELKGSIINDSIRVKLIKEEFLSFLSEKTTNTEKVKMVLESMSSDYDEQINSMMLDENKNYKIFDLDLEMTRLTESNDFGSNNSLVKRLLSGGWDFITKTSVTILSRKPVREMPAKLMDKLNQYNRTIENLEKEIDQKIIIAYRTGNRDDRKKVLGHIKRDRKFLHAMYSKKGILNREIENGIAVYPVDTFQGLFMYIIHTLYFLFKRLVFLLSLTLVKSEVFSPDRILNYVPSPGANKLIDTKGHFEYLEKVITNAGGNLPEKISKEIPDAISLSKNIQIPKQGIADAYKMIKTRELDVDIKLSKEEIQDIVSKYSEVAANESVPFIAQITRMFSNFLLSLKEFKVFILESTGTKNFYVNNYNTIVMIAVIICAVWAISLLVRYVDNIINGKVKEKDFKNFEKRSVLFFTNYKDKLNRLKAFVTKETIRGDELSKGELYGT